MCHIDVSLGACDIGGVNGVLNTMRTLQEYHDECIHMLNYQPGDYHIGPAHREVIMMCHKLKRPIQNCVALLMKLARINVQ